jgi:hypothetical protein
LPSFISLSVSVLYIFSFFALLMYFSLPSLLRSFFYLHYLCIFLSFLLSLFRIYFFLHLFNLFLSVCGLSVILPIYLNIHSSAYPPIPPISSRLSSIPRSIVPYAASCLESPSSTFLNPSTRRVPLGLKLLNCVVLIMSRS